MRELLLTPNDVRSHLLFLHGPPAERLVVDCGEAFVPMEIWGYPQGTLAQNPRPVVGDPEDADLEELVLYQPGPGPAVEALGAVRRQAAPSTPTRWSTSWSSGRRATAASSAPSASTSSPVR